MKLITRALIVIVIPFWGESWRLWARRGEEGEEWIGEEYILVGVPANCQGSDSKHESRSCIGGCWRATTEAAKLINRALSLSKAATTILSTINPFLTTRGGTNLFQKH